MAPHGQGTGQEGVFGDEADQEGKAGEAGVRRQDQDQGGGGLQAAVQDRLRLRRCRRPAGRVSDTTVGVPELNGRAWARAASTETPRNIAPRMVLMITSVVRALAAWGSRNTLTPLEMASVPVMADPPLAKARAT